MNERLRLAIEEAFDNWDECWCNTRIDYICPACEARRRVFEAAKAEGYTGREPSRMARD